MGMLSRASSLVYGRSGERYWRAASGARSIRTITPRRLGNPRQCWEVTRIVAVGPNEVGRQLQGLTSPKFLFAASFCI
jgi:hypothetical protein